MTTSMFHIADMHCSSCKERITRALADVSGIRRILANPVRRELFIEHDTSEVPVLDLFGRIEALGFSPRLNAESDALAMRRDIKRLGIAAIGMMQVVMQAITLYIGDAQDMNDAHIRLFQWSSFLITLPVIGYSAQPFFVNAWYSIKAIKQPADILSTLSMDVPVAIALAIAFLASTRTLIYGEGEVYFDSVVMFTFLLLTARLISSGLSRKRDATSVLSMLPSHCTVVTEEGDLDLAVSDLAIGQRVLVRPGERVVADGTVVKGTAHLDEALLSGESDAVVRTEGEGVTAGTLNLFQSFEFRVDALGERMRLAAIERQVACAASPGSTRTTRASLIASYFVFAMLLVATLNAICWWLLDPSSAVSATIAVLVVSCPCALSLATPAAHSAALSRLQGIGVVVNDSDVLEKAARIDTVAVDKTGTLTTGVLRVKRCVTLGAWTQETCWLLAAGCERASNHPIARAFHGKTSAPIDHVTIENQGVCGRSDYGEVRLGTAQYCVPTSNAITEGATGRLVWMSIDGEPAARFELEEELRDDTGSTLEHFRHEGLELMLLSGDSAANCRSFESRLSVYTELSPEAKTERIARAQRQHKSVLMLGDGINDLPALAEAELGAAVLEAPDVVQSRCDVLLVSRRLQPVCDLIRTAKRVRTIIRQNTTWAVAYNITMIPLAASGQLAPWMAALGMSLSSILVVANSSRLQKGIT